MLFHARPNAFTLLWLVSIAPFAYASQQDPIEAFVFSEVFRDTSAMHALDERAMPSLGWIDQPQLRVSPEQDALSENTETYSLRFRPVGKKERQLERGRIRVDWELARLRMDSSRGGLVKARYQQLVELARLEVELRLNQRQLELMQTSVNREQTNAISARFSADNLQKALIEFEQAQRALNNSTAQVKSLREATVGDYFLTNASQEIALTPALISPSAIVRRLAELSNRTAESAVLPMLAKGRLERAQLGAAADKVTSGFGLNLVEVGYQNKFVDSYEVTLGFRLPFGNSYRAARRAGREVEVAQIEERFAIQRTQARFKDQLSNAQRLLDSYQRDQQSLTQLSARSGGLASAPDALAELQLYELGLIKQLAGTHVELLELLLDGLELSGKLGSYPATNHLKGSKP